MFIRNKACNTTNKRMEFGSENIIQLNEMHMSMREGEIACCGPIAEHVRHITQHTEGE